MTPVQCAEALDRLGMRVNRLGLDRRDPENFHSEKSDIVDCLFRLSRQLSDAAGRQPSTVWRAP